MPCPKTKAERSRFIRDLQAFLESARDEDGNADPETFRKVESGASPRVALVEAGEVLATAQNAEREELTAWTSRLDTPQGQARAARLVVLKPERAREGELARQ